mmetsp:Transcript_10206/g.29961  ORF Transcript_10206/g.29961 Transcript_10206/m.29961 type:complete len:450 (+) Transcript_10206:305-1654(+)
MLSKECLAIHYLSTSGAALCVRIVNLSRLILFLPSSVRTNVLFVLVVRGFAVELLVIGILFGSGFGFLLLVARPGFHAHRQGYCFFQDLALEVHQLVLDQDHQCRKGLGDLPKGYLHDQELEGKPHVDVPVPGGPSLPQESRDQQAVDERLDDRQDLDGDEHRQDSHHHGQAVPVQQRRQENALGSRVLQQRVPRIGAEPRAQHGVLVVPHRLDLGGIVATQPVERREGDPLVGVGQLHRHHQLGTGFRLVADQAVSRIGLGAQGAVPIDLLGRCGALGGRHVLDGGEGESPLGQGLAEVGRPQLQEDLLLHSVGLQFVVFGVLSDVIGTFAGLFFLVFSFSFFFVVVVVHGCRSKHIATAGNSKGRSECSPPGRSERDSPGRSRTTTNGRRGCRHNDLQHQHQRSEDEKGRSSVSPTPAFVPTGGFDAILLHQGSNRWRSRGIHYCCL